MIIMIAFDPHYKHKPTGLFVYSILPETGLKDIFVTYSLWNLIIVKEHVKYVDDVYTELLSVSQ